jgi:uncharacterized protein (DUF2249 family)
MNDVIIASSAEDAQAAEAVEQHHAELSGALARHVGALAADVAAGRDGEAARVELVTWCEGELVPHAMAEEEGLYPAAGAQPGGRLLVEAMLAEHQVITGLVDELRSATGVRAVLAAGGLQAVFGSHLTKENEQLLPLLVAAPDVSVHELLSGMHELLGASGGHEAPAGGGHTCACGGHDDAAVPELDARVVPHAIRHATIFGALDSVRPGGGLVLVAPHDPLPMLAQLEQRQPGAFAVEYLERGPEAWRLQLTRR